MTSEVHPSQHTWLAAAGAESLHSYRLPGVFRRLDPGCYNGGRSVLTGARSVLTGAGPSTEQRYGRLARWGRHLPEAAADLAAVVGEALVLAGEVEVAQVV